MSNSVYFEMTVVGPTEAVDEFERRLRGEGSDFFLPRVRFVEDSFYDMSPAVEPITFQDMKVVERSFAGDVSNGLSASVCADHLMSSPYTDRHGGATTLSQCARDLNLDIEIFSEADGFAEHFRYQAGDGSCLFEESCDLRYVWWDPKAYKTIREFIAGEGLDPDLEQAIEAKPGDEFELGGFSDTTMSVSASAWVADHSAQSQRASEFALRIRSGEPLVNTTTGEVVWYGTTSNLSDEEIEELAEQMEQDGTWRHASVADQLAARLSVTRALGIR